MANLQVAQLILPVILVYLVPRLAPGGSCAATSAPWTQRIWRSGAPIRKDRSRNTAYGSDCGEGHEVHRGTTVAAVRPSCRSHSCAAPMASTRVPAQGPVVAALVGSEGLVRH